MTRAKTTRQKIDVYRLIKDKIQYLELMPGQVIKESEMIEEFGVSRTPIREALIRLSSESLIDIYPQRGTFVALINFGIARECTFMRHILDTEVCMQLCRRQSNLEDVLEDSFFFMEKAVKKNDVIEYIRNDNTFHRTIFRAADHELTWDIISDSRAHYNRVLTLDLRREGKMEKSLDEHRKMVEMIRAGAEKELMALLDIHNDFTHMPQREQELRAEFPAYFEV